MHRASYKQEAFLCFKKLKFAHKLLVWITHEGIEPAVFILQWVKQDIKQDNFFQNCKKYAANTIQYVHIIFHNLVMEKYD